ncbi:MAG TPA: diguanylate cyclase, partial [Rhizobiales bacterium]|nr:diguanylate cyclase [Hyphomicrobiales bacterium]
MPLGEVSVSCGMYGELSRLQIMASYRYFVVLVVAVIWFALPANSQENVIGAGFKEARIELIDTLQVVDSNNAQIAIDVPADATGQKIRMNLRATGATSPHRWAIFTLSNPDLVNRNFVLQIPRQGFIGSGVIWPSPAAARILSVTASGGLPPVQLNTQNDQSYALSVPAGGTTSFALELSGVVLTKATLWQRQAFDAQAGQVAFFNGVVLGIAFLLGVAILSMFVVRPMAVFPAAGLFAWSIIGFMLLNAGVLSLVTEPEIERTFEPVIRAVIESLMVVGLSLSLITILQLAKNAPFANVMYWISTVAGLGLAGFGFVDPLVASGLARMLFGAVAGFGLLTALVLWGRGLNRAGTSLMVWFIVAAWTIVAAIGALDLIRNDFVAPAIASGQGLILITLSFTLVQLVFGQSIAGNHFLEDSGRRALALAGSEQSVWDWQVTQKLLYVGPELERALGLEPGLMGNVNLRKWLELIHPGDRRAYESAVEAAEKRGKGSFAQEFRLRRKDGTFRWHLLRARAIIDEDGFAARLIGTLTDVTAVKRSEDRLLADAVRDRVTGLPNRALFIDRLERALRRANARGIDGLYVLVVDLDRFKNVNDGLGHEVGDSLLNVVGGRLNRMVGPDDTLARLAGDQFGIIFNGETPDREIAQVAENIAKIVALPINVRPREIFLTACIGVAR